MVRKKKSDYHILVAQNFLSSITIDGSHDDTAIRMFSGKGLSKQPFGKKLSIISQSSKLIVPNDSVVSLGTSTSLDRSNAQLSQDPSEDDHRVNFAFMGHRDTPQKKSSFFRRIAKIVSSDDVISSMASTSSRIPILEEGRQSREGFELVEHHLPENESHSSQFSFLKRLKSSITHADRWYVCSEATGIPHAVFSYLPVGSDYVDPSVPYFGNTSGPRSNKKFRSKSIFGSSDRMRHYSNFPVEELRPFVFKDADDYISLAHIRRKRQPSPFFTLFDKPMSKKDRKENGRNGEVLDDLFSECIEVPQVLNRENSYERGRSELFERGRLHQNQHAQQTRNPSKLDATDHFTVQWMDHSVTGNSIDDRLDDSFDTEVSDIYDPKVFDELALGKRTVIRLNCFIATTLHLSAPDRAKSSINENFEEKFPHVSLTMTKMKSIKQEMLELALYHAVDHHTLAIALVYFEKIVNKGLISKNNRKCVAGASLMIAMKLNDYNKAIVKDFILKAEDQLRESKSDILSYELPICSALKFKLAPPLEELQPHLDRLQFVMY